MTEPILSNNYVGPMQTALVAARRAGEAGDVPVGAVLLDDTDSVVAVDRNRREEFRDPTAHAEMLVLSFRAREIGDWRLTGHTLVVTLEPCPMCAGAAVWSRLDRSEGWSRMVSVQHPAGPKAQPQNRSHRWSPRRRMWPATRGLLPRQTLIESYSNDDPTTDRSANPRSESVLLR